MPHDAFGNKLEVGDVVYLKATVKELNEGEDDCNLLVTLAHPRKPVRLAEMWAFANAFTNAACWEKALLAPAEGHVSEEGHMLTEAKTE